MDPVAFHLGALQIRWYGIFFALGFLVGYHVLQYRGRRSTLGADRVADLTLVGMVAGVIGARLWYVVYRWQAEFRENPWEIIRIDHGGLVFYGGFVLGALALLIVCRRKRYSLGEVADLFAPVLPLAHAFGRVGCALNGCCFGRVYEGPLAMHYPPDSEVFRTQQFHGLLEPDAAACQPVFPVQLLEAAMTLALCGVLLLVEKRLRRRGELFGLYLMIYAAGRFAVEFLRGDYLERSAGLTPAQWACVVLLPAGVAVFVLARRRGAPRHA